MARIPQVTRTMKSTIATIMTVNVTEGKTENIEYTLPRTYKTNADVLKTAKELFETDTVKLVHVLDTRTEEKLYGMSEADFMAYAHVIDKTAKTDI